MHSILTRLRPTLRVELVVLCVTAWIIAVMNGSWWQAAGQGRLWIDPANWLFMAAMFVALVALHFAILVLVSNRWTIRPMLTCVVVASAVAAYFMRTYAVMLDSAMIENVLKTDTREASELITGSMLASVLVYSALPLAFIWSVRIKQPHWVGATLVRVASVAGALIVAVLAILPVNRDLTSLLRNHRELRYLVTPGNFLYGLAAQSVSQARIAGPRAAVGTDARLVRVAFAGNPRVFVLVVGETVRAANLSLLRYGRETTPELAKLNLVSFGDVRSCGTSTEVSVPCMFSPYGRAHYDEQLIRGSEGLLDVLARAGYAVKWIDNQSGCKGVCKGAGVEYQKIDPRAGGDLCADNECYDGILVHALEAELDHVRGDTVIVLHMLGNHGPAYFRRYPPEFRHFTPDCATAELRDCTRDEVVNAYDNAIRYTDHVLASLVRTLQGRSRSLDAAMLYLSDHGESLGESGFYLHGLPYAIAPDTQKQVPMLVWLSGQFAAHHAVDRACLQSKTTDALSHDNLFHSVLGVLDVQTSVYRQEQDIFAQCRHPPTESYARNTTAAPTPKVR
jgi:lipid A ethanolaminephosphotransferase